MRWKFLSGDCVILMMGQIKRLFFRMKAVIKYLHGT